MGKAITAMDIFLRYAVCYGGIPFGLRIDKPNKETLGNVNNNRNKRKIFVNISTLMENLNFEN